MSKRLFELYLETENDIRLKMDELDALRNMLKGISYDSDRVQSSPEDPMSKLMIKILDKESEIDKLIDSRYLLKLKLQELIGTVPNENWADALRARYLDGWTNEEQAMLKNCSERVIRKYLQKGLDLFRGKC